MSDHSCLNLSSIRALSGSLSRLNSAGLQAIPGSDNLSYVTNWDVTSSIFLSFQVIGSVGFGNAPPRTTGGRVFCMFFAFFGAPMLVTAALGIALMLISGADRLRRCCCCCLRTAGPRDVIKVHVLRSVVIFVVIFVLLIVIPAGILTAVERRWDYGNAIYFCLSSVLSIGFGDFIPGADWSTDARNIYRLGVGFWLIISLLMFTALWSSIHLAIGSNKEMDEPFPGEYDGLFPPQNSQQLTNTDNVPEIALAYSAQHQSAPKLFADTSSPITFNTSGPLTVNRRPLYTVPVPVGEVTRVALRY